LPNGSRQRRATRRPAYANAQYAAITSAAPIEPELLADRREDHVRVRLGQVVHLGYAASDPGPEEPAEPKPMIPWSVWKPAPWARRPGDRGS
jgi:hypothetical protein